MPAHRFETQSKKEKPKKRYSLFLFLFSLVFKRSYPHTFPSPLPWGYCSVFCVHHSSAFSSFLPLPERCIFRSASSSSFCRILRLWESSTWPQFIHFQGCIPWYKYTPVCSSNLLFLGICIVSSLCSYEHSYPLGARNNVSRVLMMNDFRILLNSVPIEMILWFFSFHLLMW